MNGVHLSKMEFTTLSVIVSCFVLCSDVRAADEHPYLTGFHLTMMSRSSDHFALKMYKNLGANESNILFSPLSMLSALSMTYTGASGRTAGQLKKALEMKLMQRTEIMQGFKVLVSEMKKEGNANISLENGVFASEKYPFNEKIIKEISQCFGAKIKNMKFKNKRRPGQEVNSFVKKATRGLIAEILPPNYIAPLNALYLVNAVYFQASWESSFPKINTRVTDFYISPTEKRKTEMMNQVNYFRCAYFASLKSLMLELPFRGNRYALYILLPDALDGLNDLRKRLTYLKFSSLFNRLGSSYRIDVSLPKFSLSESMDMKSVLKTLGIKKIFSKKKADFSRLDKSRKLFVDKVQQQAVLSIDEFGAEGAAASYAGFVMRSRPEEVTCDHPFMFVLRDKISGVSLFMGQFTGPEPRFSGLRDKVEQTERKSEEADKSPSF